MVPVHVKYGTPSILIVIEAMPTASVAVTARFAAPFPLILVPLTGADIVTVGGTIVAVTVEDVGEVVPEDVVVVPEEVGAVVPEDVVEVVPEEVVVVEVVPEDVVEVVPEDVVEVVPEDVVEVVPEDVVEVVPEDCVGLSCASVGDPALTAVFPNPARM